MIGLQLYSVRDALQADYVGTIEQIAAMGYTSIETAGDYGAEGALPADGKRLYDAHGLRVSSAHGVLVDGRTPAQVLDTIGALGTDIFVCAWAPPDNFSSLDALRHFADELNTFAAGLVSGGGRLAYHNHDHELHPLPDGPLPLIALLDYLDPAVLFEVDTYWVQVGGANVVEVVTKIGTRAPLLHIKDGPGTVGGGKTAVGDGVMDFPPILAARPAEHLIIELDDCDSDMLTAVKRSYDKLAALVTA